MARKALQIGIIGGGMIADAHMNNFAKDKRTQVRWLAETNPVRLAEMQAKFNVPHTAADYREMLADDQLDAVVVCTPPFLHVQMGLDVIRAEKHLLLEKPLTTNVADARKLLREAAKHPQVKVSGCSARHARLNPKFALVQKLIADGKLGDVYYVHHRALGRQGRGGLEYNPGAKWFLNQALAGGGPLYDWGVYDLSFHLGVLGDPKFLAADAFCTNGLDQKEAGTKVFTVEEHGAALLRFAGGLRYYYERSNNTHASAPNRTTIYGTKGGLQFGYCTWDAPEVEYLCVDRGGKGKAVSKTYKVNMSKHPGDMPALGKAFVDYLLDLAPAPISWELEVQNLAILHAIYAAADWTTGRPAR